jgi:5-methylcytosine-specific restriction endonuclease McrA
MLELVAAIALRLAIAFITDRSGTSLVICIVATALILLDRRVPRAEPEYPIWPGSRAGMPRKMWYRLKRLTHNRRWWRWYSAYLKSPQWLEGVRPAVLKRDRYQYVQCGSKHRLQVHHDTYDHVGNEMKHLGDLRTLCKTCHDKQHPRLIWFIRSPIHRAQRKKFAR